MRIELLITIYKNMVKLFLSLLVILSVTFSASEAAFCFDDVGMESHSTDKSKDSSSDKATSCVHCCCTHTIFQSNSANSSSVKVSNPVLFVSYKDHFLSFVIGPLLEPPSHV